MSFSLACLISPGGALLGALIGLLFGAPLAITIFAIFALPLFFMVIFHILNSLNEKDLEYYRNKLRRKKQEEKDKLYAPKW